jgi:hypothetical protein
VTVLEHWLADHFVLSPTYRAPTCVKGKRRMTQSNEPLRDRGERFGGKRACVEEEGTVLPTHGV